VDLSVKLDPINLKHHAILLDVDGTLLDIAPTPLAVTVPDSLRHALARIAERAGGALALVSGRPVREIDDIFMPLRLPAIGGHGAEIRPSADGATHQRRAAPLDPGLKERLKHVASNHPGAAVEDKGYSVALHYRSLPEAGPRLLQTIRRLCQSQPPHSVELLAGKAVIEVKTAGFNKGTAVRELMTYPPFAGRIPIFIGDDVTDEHAFAVMPEYNGVAISVGRELPGIAARFRSPAEVRDWLDRISCQAATTA
jgi:trehalose 6-phosphate phosphatase